MSDYRNLIVRKRAHAFALEVYLCTRSFPDSERFGLTTQLRRAAISVVSNIAEGWGRHETRDQGQFLKMARGSICEIECQLLLSGTWVISRWTIGKRSIVAAEKSAKC
jgi:four helix bundle protein